MFTLAEKAFLYAQFRRPNQGQGKNNLFIYLLLFNLFNYIFYFC